MAQTDMPVDPRRSRSSWLHEAMYRLGALGVIWGQTSGHHSPRSRPMSSFMISLEPAQILETRASRQARSTRYSFM